MYTGNIGEYEFEITVARRGKDHFLTALVSLRKADNEFEVDFQHSGRPDNESVQKLLSKALQVEFPSVNPRWIRRLRGAILWSQIDYLREEGPADPSDVIKIDFGQETIITITCYEDMAGCVLWDCKVRDAHGQDLDKTIWQDDAESEIMYWLYNHISSTAVAEHEQEIRDKMTEIIQRHIVT